MLFVDLVIDVAPESWHDLVDFVVLVGGFIARTGNDEGRSRFVDEDRVDFVDDAEVVATLNAGGRVKLGAVLFPHGSRARRRAHRPADCPLTANCGT